MAELSPAQQAQIRQSDAHREQLAQQLERRDRIRHLEEELEDREAEIRRHHQDFERWEEMAAKGARQIARAQQLERERDQARAEADRLGDRAAVLEGQVAELLPWARDAWRRWAHRSSTADLDGSLREAAAALLIRDLTGEFGEVAP